MGNVNRIPSEDDMYSVIVYEASLDGSSEKRQYPGTVCTTCVLAAFYGLAPAPTSPCARWKCQMHHKIFS